MKVHRRKDNKKKGILFFIGLILYVVFAIFVFDFNQETHESSSAHGSKQKEVLGSCSSERVLNWQEIPDIDVEEFTEVKGEVKGAVGGLGRCEPVVYELPMQFFCGGGGAYDVHEWEIYNPNIMFVGAEAPYDNLVLINNPDGLTAWRNAAELIMDEEDYYINMPPPRELLDSSPLPDPLKRELFEMHFSSTGERWRDEVFFDSLPDEYNSVCGEVVNPGWFNVGGTNRLEEEMVHSVSPPGLMSLPSRNFTGLMCGQQYRNVNPGCMLLLCENNPVRCPPLLCPDGCPIVGTVNVDAPLGSTERCERGDCGIRYWEAGKILTSPPPWVEIMQPDLDPYYLENDYLVANPVFPELGEQLPVVITTPSRVRIDPSDCEHYLNSRWDISIWQHVYDLEEMFTYPDYPEKKTIDEHWEEIEEEMRQRC